MIPRNLVEACFKQVGGSLQSAIIQIIPERSYFLASLAV